MACKDLEEPAKVCGKGSSFALPLDTGGVGSELSSGIESLELPGSVLAGQDGVSWGLGVLGRLVSFWMVATILVSASCNRLLTLSVSSSSGVEGVLGLDLYSVVSELSFLNSLGIVISSASEVLGLWKCTVRLLRYFHLESVVSHLICLPLKVAVRSMKSKSWTSSKWRTRNQNFLVTSVSLFAVNFQGVPTPSHQIPGIKKRANRHHVSL